MCYVLKDPRGQGHVLEDSITITEAYVMNTMKIAKLVERKVSHHLLNQSNSMNPDFLVA